MYNILYHVIELYRSICDNILISNFPVGYANATKPLPKRCGSWPGNLQILVDMQHCAEAHKSQSSERQPGWSSKRDL